ncbi:MAG: isoprenylcysteine carboxylmethyltransferase family protein [Erysipelotrichaceae bacterium]|nr:isoprenylcysteine carboxylmethyltransferase family protein [Erysipelotrichaceae bacterium]
MKKKLLTEALMKYLAGVLLVTGLLFIPAGTLKWRNGWIFMAILFIPMFFAGIIMYLKAPDLLRSRLDNKEKEAEQKDVIGYSGIMFIAVFIVAGLNYRFKWNSLPDIVVWAGIIIFLLSYAMFGEVLRENRYLSRTIKVTDDQKVVDTGLYGIVRHPMYSASTFLFLSMPLVLNSLYSFLIMLAYIPLIMKRIRNEEKVLEEGLPGYREYEKIIRYRMIPYIW